MPKAKNILSDEKRFSGLKSLKRSSTSFAASPLETELETFDNAFPKREYLVEFGCPEFTSLCPVTGQPDCGTITVRYVPASKCVESKSLKLFIFSFRNHNTFHEEAVNIILDAVARACRPRWAEVVGDFNPRGGISIRVVARTGRRPAIHE